MRKMNFRVSKHCLAVVLVAGGIALAPAALAYSEGQFRLVTTEQEAQLDQIRDREVEQIKIVLGRRFAESRRPDILLRLAELYTEKSRFYFLKENEIHQKLIREGHKPKHVDHARSRQYLTSSTNACLAILQSRVSFSKLDQVYYILGYNAQELGKRKDAERYYGVIAKRYPQSSFAPEAFRNLAEFAFEQNKFKASLGYYEQAARFTNVPSYPRTLYKLAWAYFKTRQRTEALKHMKRVVELSGNQEGFVGLRDEAMNDLVMFFAEAGQWKEARDYFGRISGGAEVYVKALGKLSGLYERRGDYRLALSVNNTLLDEYGDKRPELVYDILGRNVELYRKLGNRKGEDAELGRLARFYVEHADDIGKGEDNEVTFLRTKNYFRGRATEVHKEAQKKKDPKLYSRAADLYALYISAFLAKPDSEKGRRELSEIRTYQADSLLASSREAEAIPVLERTLRDEGEAKLRKEAGTTLLNLLIKKLDAQTAKSRATSPELEKQFLEVSQAFEEAFSDDKLVSELRYKRARLAAVRSGPEGLNAEAREALEELIEKYPARPEAVTAAHDLVGDAVKRKDLEEASKLSTAYLANRPLLSADKDGSLAKYLQSVITHQSFETVQELEKDEKHEKAAVEYEKLANAAKGDREVAYKAFNNAAVNFERAGRRDEAARVFAVMVSRFNSAGPRDELKRLASSYLWDSQFAQAAALYGKLAVNPAYSRDERMSFTRTAFYLDWGTGDTASAFLLMHRGLRELCAAGPGLSDDRCHELSLEFGRMLIEAGKLQEALDTLRSYADKAHRETRKAQANVLIAQIYEKLHDQRKAARYYELAAQSVVPGSKAADAERNAAARAAFQLVEPSFARFSKIRLELPEERLKSATKAKLGELEGLVTRYLNVVKYGDGEWGIAALERLYDAFSSFATELENAPVPPKLDASKRELYVRGIRQVAQPMMARAMEFLRQGQQKGLQLAVTSPTFLALTQRLSRQLPKEYPPAHYALAEGKAGTPATRSELRLLGKTEDFNASRLKHNPKDSSAWVELGNAEALAGRLRLARLMYEQALVVNPRNTAALSNLSVTLLLEQRPIEATQGFAKAVELAETDKDLRLNLAKTLLAFHHFKPALDTLRGLSARFPQDNEIAEAHAVALLGVGELPQAGSRLKQLDAGDSKRFNLWYNWDVWALLAGDKDDHEDALERLKDRRAEAGSLERSQIEVVLEILGKGVR